MPPVRNGHRRMRWDRAEKVATYFIPKQLLEPLEKLSICLSSS